MKWETRCSVGGYDETLVIKGVLLSFFHGKRKQSAKRGSEKLQIVRSLWIFGLDEYKVDRNTMVISN